LENFFNLGRIIKLITEYVKDNIRRIYLLKQYCCLLGFISLDIEYGAGIGYSSPEATEISGIRGEERELGRFWDLLRGEGRGYPSHLGRAKG